MNDKPCKVVCVECGADAGNEPPYCPQCGAEEPWEVEYRYDFDDVELPVIFTVEHYDDHHGMWDDFVDELFGLPGLTGSDIANLPDELPPMGSCMVDMYFKLTEDLELEGPFLEKQEAREA